MDLPVWGIAVIAIYSLLQIPAVILVARYCEVDSEDLPTPPMRARWRDGNPQQSRNPPETEESTAGRVAADSDAPSVTPPPEPSPSNPVTPNGESDPAGAVAPGEDPDPTIPSSPAPTSEADDVRCANCGTENDPSFARCRHCVAEL